MPVLSATTFVDAPQASVAGLLRDTSVAAQALGRAGHRWVGERRLLVVGDEVRVEGRLLGLRWAQRTRITAVSTSGMTSQLVRGPLRELVHTTTLTPQDNGTLVHDELSWRSRTGVLADVLAVRRSMRRVLAARSTVLVERAAELAAAKVVVATALIRDGKLLAAQRREPPALAGRWELPGGQVEPGESEEAAVERECQEELATTVRVTGRLGTDLPIDFGVLRVHRAELLGAEPQALEHQELRWVDATELSELDWLDADLAVLPELTAELIALSTEPGCVGSRQSGHEH
ncbi:NUDIX domain-containing protein [Pseudonocardia sp. TRM90224]|uniref:NUDIX domain-containing protein n=1 Tax=Pseudonocardia sp. TRM90224 TaxID=2812678 RepID=UPI001E2FB5AD|nr:NUDIX domain-containing protein [Pseudonocardia sp. TRM90224]